MEKYFWSFLGREGVLRKISYEMFDFDYFCEKTCSIVMFSLLLYRFHKC